jgi:hypothetical protein
VFLPGSRYEHVPRAVWVDRDGRAHPYTLLRELPPDPPIRQRHQVADGERLDLIAHRMYGDPEQFWRITDANRALRPDDLEVVGSLLRIPLALR